MLVVGRQTLGEQDAQGEHQLFVTADLAALSSHRTAPKFGRTVPTVPDDSPWDDHVILVGRVLNAVTKINEYWFTGSTE